MSVPVRLEGLQEQLGVFGDRPYLLSVDADGRPRAIEASVVWDGAQFTMGAGRSTRANAAGRPAVSLLWAPVEPGGYSLIVDGEASLTGDEGVVVIPGKAVLHRSRPRPEGAPAVTACEMDCVPVLRAD